MTREELKELIDEEIKENGQGEITGPVLNNVLQRMLETLPGQRNPETNSELFNSDFNTATGENSHAEGLGTKAVASASHAEGRYNKGYDEAIHEVGIGTNNSTRRDAHVITVDGKHYVLGLGGFNTGNEDLADCEDLAIVVNNRVTTEQMTAAILVEKLRAEGAEAQLRTNLQNKIPIPNNLREVIGSELDNLYGVYMYKGYPCHCRTIIHNNEYKLVICAEHGGTSGVSGQKYFVYGDHGGNIVLESTYDSTNVPDWVKRGFGEATATASYPGLLSSDYYKKLRDLPTKTELSGIIETLRTTDSDLHNEVLTEQGRAEDAEAELSARIDAIVQGRDVRDIVPNYQALLDYDTTTLGDNDIIMVLLDNTKSDHTTYYRWHATEQTWEFIGGLAFTYTKTEIDQKFSDLHIVLPSFGAESSQEMLEQVDETIRHAGADAQFKIAIPVDDLQGNVTVTYVKTNPMHTYIGVFADDRSELYHITRTIPAPRTYTCEVVTKVFATADALASLIKDLYNADPAEGEEKGDIVKINEALEGKQDTNKMQSVLTESDTNYPSSNAVAGYVQGREVFVRGDGTRSAIKKGSGSIATGIDSLAEGFESEASGPRSHAEGNKTLAANNNSHAEGSSSTAGGNSSHAEGAETYAFGDQSHAEGRLTRAIGKCSHTEGLGTRADTTPPELPTNPPTTHAENAHAEGAYTYAEGNGSHAEGFGTQAIGQYAHAEGNRTQAIGNYSHAEGSFSETHGNQSHAEGNYTITSDGNLAEHAEGRCNASHHKSGSSWGDRLNTLHSVGMGTSTTNRRNAHEIMQNGDHYIVGVGGYDGTNPGEAKTLQQVIATFQDETTVDELVLKSGTHDSNRIAFNILASHLRLMKEVVYLNTVTNTYYRLNTWKQDGAVFRFSYLREDGDNLVVTRFSLDSTGKVS